MKAKRRFLLGCAMRLSPLAVALFFIFPESTLAKLHFDPSLISGDAGGVADLSRFETGENQLPGNYFVDIYLNDNNVASRSLQFVSARNGQQRSLAEVRDNTGLMACLTRNDLADMGVNTAAFPELESQPGHRCLSPGKYIPQAYTSFDFQKMRLDISMPQAALQQRVHGWIAPERWEEGINAALLSWQFSGDENRGRYGDSRSQYLNLTSGLNLGAWRLRDNSTWNHNVSDSGSQQRWRHLYTYLERAIVPWRSELTLGDSLTNSDVFDSLSFRGLQLATDDNMYPDTMRGFAPQIKGVANSSATVSIRQNGNIIYRTFVAAGAFVINDLYPMSSGGDLEVIVTESDGSSHVTTVPYSSLPVLQRSGHIRYGITAGRYRNTSSDYDEPAFAQATLLWGLPHGVTAYGGTQLSGDYRAAALGLGANMGGWGALSFDVTHANSTLADGSRHAGQSLRFLYGRSLLSTGTTFQLAGYRFSTRGFHTLDETALKRMTGWADDSNMVDAAGRPIKRNWLDHYDLYRDKRARLQANISQHIGGLGTLFLTGSRQTYWNNSTSTTSLQAGFNGTLGRVSYDLSYGYSRYSNQSRPDRTLYFSLSVPLDWGRENNSMWANWNTTRDSDGHMAQQLGLSGNALEKGNLEWSLSQGYGQRDGSSGDASVKYNGTYGNASVGYGYSRNYRQTRYGLSGSALWHSDGVTFGQPLGITNVLIRAPGASDVAVENGTGVRTDWRGYAVLPYASMYRENRIALDVSQLDNHTDVDNAVSRVVPTRGAVVRADFKTRTGVRALMTLTRNGKPIPFGASVSTVSGATNGLVGDEGLVYLAGLAPKGKLIAQWGRGSNQRCTVYYRLPDDALQQPMIYLQEACR